MYENHLESSGATDSSVYAYIIGEAKKVSKWTYQLVEQGNATEEEVNTWFSRSTELEGICLYKMDNEDKEHMSDTLSVAVKYGSNSAKLYLALHYIDTAKGILTSVNTSAPSVFGCLFKSGKEPLNEEDKNQEKANQYYSKAVTLLEDYIANYSEEGAMKDEFPTACRQVAYLYENGFGVPKDFEKAKYYKGMIGA